MPSRHIFRFALFGNKFPCARGISSYWCNNQHISVVQLLTYYYHWPFLLTFQKRCTVDSLLLTFQKRCTADSSMRLSYTGLKLWRPTLSNNFFQVLKSYPFATLLPNVRCWHPRDHPFAEPPFNFLTQRVSETSQSLFCHQSLASTSSYSNCTKTTLKKGCEWGSTASIYNSGGRCSLLCLSRPTPKIIEMSPKWFWDSLNHWTYFGSQIEGSR